MITINEGKLLINKNGNLVPDSCACDMVLVDYSTGRAEHHNIFAALKRYVQSQGKDIIRNGSYFAVKIFFKVGSYLYFIGNFRSTDSSIIFNIFKYDYDNQVVTHIANPLNLAHDANRTWYATNDGTNIYLSYYSLVKISAEDLSNIWVIDRYDFYDTNLQGGVSYQDGYIVVTSRPRIKAILTTDGQVVEPVCYLDSNSKIKAFTPTTYCSGNTVGAAYAVQMINSSSFFWVYMDCSGKGYHVRFARICYRPQASLATGTVIDTGSFYSFNIIQYGDYLYLSRNDGGVYTLKQYNYSDIEQPSCVQLDDDDYEITLAQPVAVYSIGSASAGLSSVVFDKNLNKILAVKTDDDNPDFGSPYRYQIMGLDLNLSIQKSFHNAGRVNLTKDYSAKPYTFDSQKFIVAHSDCTEMIMSSYWKKGVLFKLYTYLSDALYSNDGWCLHNDSGGVTRILKPKLQHTSGGLAFNRDLPYSKDAFVRDRYTVDTYKCQKDYPNTQWQNYPLGSKFLGAWKPASYTYNDKVVYVNKVWYLKNGYTRTVDDTTPPNSDSAWAVYSSSFTPRAYAVDSVVTWARSTSPYPPSYHWICISPRTISDLIPPDEDTQGWKLLREYITGDTDGWLKLWQPCQDEPYIGADWQDFWEEVD